MSDPYSDNSIKNTVLRPNGSTKLVMSKWHKYGTLNRVTRVGNLSVISSLNEQWPCNVWLCFVTKTNLYITLGRVFLPRQLWIVN